MLNELSQHKLAYSVLFLILSFHLIFFYLVWPDHMLQRIAAGSLSLSYLFWGIFAHVKAEHITGKIIREYLFVSLLAGGILFFITI